MKGEPDIIQQYQQQFEIAVGQLKKEGEALGLPMALVEPSIEDEEEARKVNFKKKTVTNSFKLTEKHRFDNINAQSISKVK